MTDDQNYRHGQARAAVLCSDSRRRAALEALANAAGCRLLGGYSLDTLPVPPHILLTELSSKSDADVDALAKLGLYAEAHGCAVLAWIDMELLDPAYAALPRAQFIVSDNDEEAPALLAALLADGGGARVAEERKGADFVALHRLSDELAEVARRLADMADDARPPAPSLTLVPPADVPAPVVPVTASDIRVLIRRRRMRMEFFGNDMLADPAWDILLDLFAAQMEEGDVSVSSLCIAAAVPPTTALRWIGAMTEAGMLVRRFDPNDGRRVFISLSADTATRMKQYFAAVGGKSAVI